MRKAKEVIQTSTAMKQIYRHHFVSYVIKDDVDAIQSLYKISKHLMNSKKINTLKEDLGKNYKVIMSRFQAFNSTYQLTEQYRQMEREATNKKQVEHARNRLKEICVILPVINDSIILIFEALVRNTDLKNIPIAHATTRDSVDNTMPLSFSEEHGGS